MVPGSYSNSAGVKHLPDVEVVNALHDKGYNGHFLLCSPNQGSTFRSAYLGGGILEQLVLVRSHVVFPKRVNEVKPIFPRDDISDVGRARFEFIRKIVIRRLLKGNLFYHLTATVIGGHFFKQMTFPIQDACACRTIHLVS